MPNQFEDVKSVLDTIIANWTQANGGAPDLIAKHGEAFGWETREKLLAATWFGTPLIQSELIGVAGQGKNVNLVIDLTTGGVQGQPQMPLGGLNLDGSFLALDSPEIQTVIAWVEAGCPPTPPPPPPHASPTKKASQRRSAHE